MLGVWVVIIFLVVVVTLVLASVRVEEGDTETGWVYFISQVGGAVSEPPAPIKIGSTMRDPLTERLPELETGSSTPLEVLYTIVSSHPLVLERAIHKELAPFRLHGEWFDRNATLAWLDHVTEGAG